MRLSKKRFKAVAALLTFSLLAGSLPTLSCTPKNQPQEPDKEDDPYMNGADKYLDCSEEYDIENALFLLPSGNELEYSGAGLRPTAEITADGALCSGLWQNQTANTSIAIPITDSITDYDSLMINVYSEVANNSGITLCLYCQHNPTEGKASYKKYPIKVDWTGWKQIIIPVSDMSDAYSADLGKANKLLFGATGWGNTPMEDTKLYFDSIYFTNKLYTFTHDVETLGDYNYDHIMSTLTELIVGTTAINNADETTKSRLDTYVTHAKNTVKAMRSAGDPWNYDMSTTAGITSQYDRIWVLARAYAIEGSEYYHNAEHLALIKSAMEYMHENYYKDKNAKSYPTRNNWWDWNIGSAQKIVDILIMCRDGFTQAEIDKYLEPVNKYVPLPSMTMANLVDLAYVCIGAAALQRDALRLVLSRNKLDECMGYVTYGDGFYRDGSFIQHTVIPYTGSYGPIMLEALSKIILAIDDTCFHAREELITEQYGWAVDSFVPLMYHGAFYGNVRGRSICRSSTDVSLGFTAVEGMLRMTKYVSQDRARVLKSIIKEYIQYNDEYYSSALEPYDRALYLEIKNDTAVTARTNYELVKMFALMDRPVAALKDYAVSVSLSSSRIAKYEAINEENGKGWYTGDGMLYIYTTVNDYEAAYWKNVNYYRLPGTTVTTAPRVDENIGTGDTLSKYDLVGGAYLGNAMAVAMQFESSTDKMKTPSKGTPFISDLKGKKAWFIFDGEVVCLGADISCSDKYATETVIDNRRLASTEKLYANGEEITDTSGSVLDCRSVWYSSLGGVYLPNATDVNFNRTDKKTSFLELYMDHGTKFTDGTYAYVMLPTMTKEETVAYSASPDVEIIANTASVQAVRDSSTATESYIFWEKGEYNGVEVSAPCCVVINETEIAVSDPTMKLAELTVTVNGKSFTCEPRDGQTYVFDLGK